MKRHSIGIDIVTDYYEMVKEKTEAIKLYLLEPKAKYETTKSKKRYAIR